jgi:hypothetical protein
MKKRAFSVLRSVLTIFFCFFVFSVFSQTKDTLVIFNEFVQSWTWVIGGAIQYVSGYLVPLFPKLNDVLINKTFKVILIAIPFLLAFFMGVVGLKDLTTVLPTIIQSIFSGLGFYNVFKALYPNSANTSLKGS